MMKARKLNKLITIIAAVFLLAGTGLAQNIDYQRMDRDLKISEDILKTLVSDNIVKEFYSEENIKGVYIDTYGVVFMVPLSNYSISGDRAKTAKERYEGMKDNFTEYFSSYADLISQVKPTDNISIIATPPDRLSTSVYFVDRADAVLAMSASGREKELFEITPFIMSVKKSDIARYRSGSLNDAQFKNVVQLNEIGKDSKNYISKDFMKDVKILRGILQVSINDNFTTNISSSNFQGTYIKDHGVLFTINGGSVSVPVPLILDGDARGYVFDTRNNEVTNTGTGSNLVTVIELQNALHEEDERLALTYRDFGNYGFKGSNEKMLSTIIESITDALANYGHTLREMKPDEKITVMYSSRGERMSRRANKNLMLTVAYKDIVAYTRGSINMNAFKAKVLARTY
ncbi:hypothetical protein ACFL6G_06635 [candidate division KSB1 bacterium]